MSCRTEHKEVWKLRDISQTRCVTSYRRVCCLTVTSTGQRPLMGWEACIADGVVMQLVAPVQGAHLLSVPSAPRMLWLMSPATSHSLQSCCTCRPAFLIRAAETSAKAQHRRRPRLLHVRAAARPSMKPEQKATLTGQAGHHLP